MWWFASLGVAHGSLFVADPTLCLDIERLDNELLLLLGPRAATIDVHVAVRATAAPPAQREVDVAASRVGEPLWSGDLLIEPADCGALAEAVALMVHRGLRALPTWDLPAAARRATTRWRVGIGGVVGTRGDLRAGPFLGLDRSLWRELALWTSVQGFASSVAPIGDGGARIVGGELGAGVALDGPRGAARLGARAGPGWAVGTGFDDNRVAAIPLAAITLAGEWRPAGPWAVVAQLDVPLLRAALADTDGSTWREGPMRLGLALSLHGPIERTRAASEASAAQRAWSGR